MTDPDRLRVFLSLRDQLAQAQQSIDRASREIEPYSHKLEFQGLLGDFARAADGLRKTRNTLEVSIMTTEARIAQREALARRKEEAR
jgi:hypothetical protein